LFSRGFFPEKLGGLQPALVVRATTDRPTIYRDYDSLLEMGFHSIILSLNTKTAFPKEHRFLLIQFRISEIQGGQGATKKLVAKRYD